MAEKNIKARIVHKHDIDANWQLATNFIPKQGEIIVYDVDENYSYERIKIGDGVQNVNALSFVDDALRTEILEQINSVNTKVNEVSTLVGDTSVSDQINEALLNSQADWSQNDETAEGYIKNRPFYTKDPQEIELINDTLSFELLDGLYICEIGSLSYVLKIGTEIIVNYDGTEYNSFIQKFDFGFYAYNASLMNGLTGMDFANTGEPFMVHYYNGEIAIYTVDTAATHNIIISVVNIEDVKIDKKYMPEPIHIADKDVYAAVGLTSFNPVDITQTIEFPIVDLKAGDVVQLYINVTGSDTVSGADYEAVGEIAINAQVEDYIVGSEVVGKELVFDPIVLINNLRFSSAASTLKSIILNYYGDAAMRLKGTLAESILTGFSSSFSGQIDIAYPQTISAFDGLDVWSLTGGSVQRFTVSVDDSGIITTTNMEDGSQVKFAKEGLGFGKAGSNTNAEIFNDYVNSDATGKYSHAEGYKTTAGNYAAHAEGRDSKASGMYSHAEGYNSTASADCGHAEGSVSTASGNAAHSEGQGTIASGQCSHSEGYNTTAMGHSSHSEGRSSNDVPTDITTSTSNDTIITTWENTKFNLAKYDQCHTEGNDTLALDSCAHAEGYQTIASGGYSHSEGYKTRAISTATHAEGYNAIASGAYSHVEGEGTLASSANQHVQGKYNIEDTETKYVHIVGNGTSSTRSNAHTIDWSGNAWFAGDVYIGGTSQDDAEKLVKQSELPAEIAIDATLAVEGQAADAKATGDAIGNLNTLVGDTSVAEQISEATYTQSEVDDMVAAVKQFCLPKIRSITLTENNWVFSANYYYQDVPVGVCTPTSKVDLQPTYSQLATWQDDGLAFTTQSKDGIVRVWAIPDAPREDITVQISVQEVLEV